MEGYYPDEIDAIAFGSVADPILPVRIKGLCWTSKESPLSSIDLKKKNLVKVGLSYMLDYAWKKNANSTFGRFSASVYRSMIKKVLAKRCGLEGIPIRFVDHHHAHAASA